MPQQQQATPSKQHSISVIIYKILDAYIFMCVEYIKTFIRECLLLLSQVVNFFIKMLLHLVYKPGPYELNVTHRPNKFYSMVENGTALLSPLPKLFQPWRFQQQSKRLKNKQSPPQGSTITSRHGRSKTFHSSQTDFLNFKSSSTSSATLPMSKSQASLSDFAAAEDGGDDLDGTGQLIPDGHTNRRKSDILRSRKSSVPDLVTDRKSLSDSESVTPQKSSHPRSSSSSSSTSNLFSVNGCQNRLNQLLEKTIMLNTTTRDRRQIASNTKTPMASDELEEIQKRELEDDEDMTPMDDDLNTVDSVDLGTDDEDIVITERTILGRIYSRIVSVLLWFIMLIWYIPSLFKPPTLKTHSYVRNDKVHLYEKKSTGLLQDLTIALYEFVDAIAQAIRLAIRFEWIKCWKQIRFSFALFKPSVFLSDEGIDDRSVEQVIIDEGFPHESVTCETQDGYVLHMDRIPNKTARKVVYFQHGILDSGFAWVGNGVSHSIALRAHSLGDVDVFLGNFRGYGMSPHYLETTDRFNKKNFWDYSFNEHAFYDVRAFVEKIVEMKKRELNCNEDGFTITVVAHSMGAASILAYLVHSKLTNQKHYMNKVILLAPAGVHQKTPWVASLMSYTFMPIARRIVPYFGITTRSKKILFAKLLQDINNHPALRALWAVTVSKLLLGGSVEDSPFQYVHNLIYQSYNGTSVQVADHFVQMKKSGTFQAYDYGTAEENMQHYGQEKPWNFLEHYKDIDPMIPIHILYGDDDRTIPPHNVLTHANELQRWHGSDYVHVKKFHDCGHLELTLGMNVKVIKYILDQIRSQN